MQTKDLFKINNSSRRLNESFFKAFGKKINFEAFDLPQLQDARNRLRTQLSQIRSDSSFNENLENDAYHQARWMLDAINAEISEREEFIVGQTNEESEYSTNEAYINDASDAIEILANIRKQSKMAERGEGDPVRPNQLVNDLWDVITWIENNMKESFGENRTQGETMNRLHEGEVQQASAIVTAKTMADRVGRWIEELSGMENDTLLQLGDSIRDEMGQEQAKAFISTVAPAIQQALDALKGTRETIATGVRTLTGEEQAASMLGAEPEAGGDMAGGDEMAPAEPDMMNAPEAGAEDEFAAAEPAAGGAEEAGREQRESINYQHRLLKVLAG